MKNSKELLVKANIIPRLKLGLKDEKGVVRGTGPHRVKILEDKVQNGKDPQTGEIRPIVRYVFEENGEKRRYDVPVKDKAGELHYLVQRLAEVGEGEEVIMEMKRKGVKNYVEVLSIKEAAEIEVDADSDDHDLDYEDDKSEIQA